MISFMLEDGVLKAALLVLVALCIVRAGLSLFDRAADTITRPPNHLALAMARGGFKRLERRLHDVAKPRPPGTRADGLVTAGLMAVMGSILLVLAMTVGVNGLMVLLIAAPAIVNQAEPQPAGLLAIAFYLICCVSARFIWRLGRADLRAAMRRGGAASEASAL